MGIPRCGGLVVECDALALALVQMRFPVELDLLNKVPRDPRKRCDNRE